MNPKLAKRLQSIDTLLACRQFEAAERELRHALLKFPASADLLLMSGQVRALQGDGSAAIALFERCVAIDPGHPQGWQLLGRSLFDAGRNAEAAAAFAREARIGGRADALVSCGVAHQAANQIEPAIAAYRAALAAGADNYTLRLNLGMSLFTAHRYRDAIEQLRQALAHSPEDPVALYNLGSSALELGEPEQALACFRRARLPAAEHAALYTMSFLPEIDPEALSDAHRAWGSSVQASLPQTGREAPPRARGSSERLRIGYLSADLRAHPVMFFLEPVLAAHDRQRVEITCYADVHRADDHTARARALAEHWRDIAGRSDEEVARMIREDGIDILVELGGHTGTRLRLLARRVAPVQVSYLGYACTSGLESIDYRFSEALLDPPGEERLYTEKLLRLAPTCYCYRPPAAAPEPAPSPCIANGQLTFGALCRAHKINPRTIALWAAAMAACPGSRLLLIARLFADEHARQRIRNAFADLGIAAERLEFEGEMSLESYLAAHARIDLVLDAVPWNGHTNALHALWMGVPTLTLRGRHHSARFGEMIMSHLGMSEFVAQDEADFARLAARLDRQRERLAKLRGEWRTRLRDSCLCDAAALARALEAAYEAIYAPQPAA